MGDIRADDYDHIEVRLNATSTTTKYAGCGTHRIKVIATIEKRYARELRDRLNQLLGDK